MTRFMLRFAALLLPAAMLAAPAAAQVITHKPDSSEDMMVLAVMATGTEADKLRFEQAATAQGFAADRSKNSKGEDEVMVVIMPDAKPGPFWQFYRDARAGKYGTLQFDIAITPYAAVQESRDFINEARVFPAASIPMPGE